MTPSYLTLPYKLERPTPPFEGDDIRYPESLVRHFLKNFTKPGDKVIDLFTGLGTTLFVAEEMKRNPFGMEADRDRYEWVAGQMEHWMQLLHGDAAKIAAAGFPKMDFCMTSPPFMARTQSWNPLFAGNPKKSGYDAYLKQMGKIFGALAKIMKRGSHVVVQVDNIPGKTFTPLIRDMGNEIARSFKPVGETVVAWDGGPKDYPLTNCLIFRA